MTENDFLKDQIEAILAENEHPLNLVYGVFDTYMDMGEEFKVACTLFAAHTHAIKRLDMTAYLHISAATPEAGKTRLSEILQCLCARSEEVSFATSAALKRIAMEGNSKKGPATLFMDEIDMSLKDEHLMGYLNQGFTRGHSVPLNIPSDGKTWKVVKVDPFCPKVLTGIGDLPAKALASRCIPIVLARRANSEKKLPRWGERQKPKLAPIAGALSEWAENVVLLDPDDKDFPENFYPETLGDRQQDMWESLLLIAQAGGKEWLKKGHEAAIKICKKSSRPFAIGESLLRDIKIAMENKEDISTDELVQRLSTEEFTWGTYLHHNYIPWQWEPDRGIYKAGIIIGQILGTFGIASMRIRSGISQARGFKRVQFEDYWERYGL